MVRFVPAWDIPTEAKKDYSLFETEIDGSRFRMEFNEIGNFCMCKEDKAKNSFEFKLPPIPNEIYMAAYFFFKGISDRHNTEAALQLFYDREENAYFLSVPTQYVSHASVDYDRDYELECNYLLVADIHSHGTIPAFFSATDDADELGTRLFIVFGDFRSKWTAKLRAGSGGYFKDIEKDDIFSYETVCMSDVNEILNNLTLQMCHIHF